MLIANLDAVPGLLIALGLAPVCGFAIVGVIRMMLENELDFAPGMTAIALLVAVMVLTIMSKNQVAAGVVLVCLLALLAFYPYAVDQFANAEVRGVDIDKLDKVHQEISRNPGNVSTYFALAEALYALGLEGHAVVLTEKTLEGLSTNMDPIKNQSLRDVFRSEEVRAKEWRRRIRDKEAFRALACPRCGHRNEAGSIACGGCQGPFLLDLARKADPRPGVRKRVVFAWAMVAGFLAGTAYAWSILEGNARWAVFAGGLALIGGVFTWLFAPRRLGRR